MYSRASCHVIPRDVEKRVLDRGIETISKNLDREAKKGKITEADKPVIVARIKSATDAGAVVAADFVVEAVLKQPDLRLRVLNDVDAALRPDAIGGQSSRVHCSQIAGQGSRVTNHMSRHFRHALLITDHCITSGRHQSRNRRNFFRLPG